MKNVLNIRSHFLYITTRRVCVRMYFEKVALVNNFTPPKKKNGKGLMGGGDVAFRFQLDACIRRDAATTAEMSDRARSRLCSALMRTIGAGGLVDGGSDDDDLLPFLPVSEHNVSYPRNIRR